MKRDNQVRLYENIITPFNRINTNVLCKEFEDRRQSENNSTVHSEAQIDNNPQPEQRRNRLPRLRRRNIWRQDSSAPVSSPNITTDNTAERYLPPYLELSASETGTPLSTGHLIELSLLAEQFNCTRLKDIASFLHRE